MSIVGGTSQQEKKKTKPPGKRCNWLVEAFRSWSILYFIYSSAVTKCYFPITLLCSFQLGSLSFLQSNVAT